MAPCGKSRHCRPPFTWVRKKCSWWAWVNPNDPVFPGGRQPQPARGPTLASIAGHTMASVFHDTLQADVEQTNRVTQTIQNLPRNTADDLPYKSIDVMLIQPTQSLDALAQAHLGALPVSTRRALAGLGVLRGGGGTLASYLLFEPDFVQALIAMGESDAYAKKAQLLDFFKSPAVAAMR